MKYLLDTNICICLLRGSKDMADKIDSVGLQNCGISEITKAELLIGAAMSRSAKHSEGLSHFLDALEIIPISDIIECYASEKVRLMRLGTPIEDFDILIGCTAIEYGLTMVTDNISHLGRLNGIILENWVTH